MDVVVDGKEHTAVEYKDKWYLHKINFKFTCDENPKGHAYLSGDDVKEVEKAWLDTLPTWR